MFQELLIILVIVFGASALYLAYERYFNRSKTSHSDLYINALRDLLDNRQEAAFTKLRQVVEQTGIGLVMVSHLKRPEGRGHEEGAQTSLGHLRGSQGIAQLSDIVIGCERNQQAEANLRNELQLRVLKNRFSGATGHCDKLLYDQDTGRLVVPMSHYFQT